jgi:two-component system LytT family response regulator
MFDNKKILIIDDEESARLYLATIVTELYPGLAIQLAATPSEALFLMKKECIDLILLDVEMPGMTGLELVENIRKISNSTPVIFVSAYKRAEFIQRAIRLNAVDYIDKPVDPAELNNALLKAFKTNYNSIQNSKRSEQHNDRFCLLTDSGEMFIEVNEIVYFKTLKRYSLVYFADGSSKIARDNLEGLSKRLPENSFLRVSRQHIVNIKSIKYVSKSNKSITLQSCNLQIVLDKIYPTILAILISKFSLK